MNQKNRRYMKFNSSLDFGEAEPGGRCKDQVQAMDEYSFAGYNGAMTTLKEQFKRLYHVTVFRRKSLDITWTRAGVICGLLGLAGAVEVIYGLSPMIGVLLIICAGSLGFMIHLLHRMLITCKELQNSLEFFNLASMHQPGILIAEMFSRYKLTPLENDDPVTEEELDANTEIAKELAQATIDTFYAETEQAIQESLADIKAGKYDPEEFAKSHMRKMRSL